MWYPPQQQQQQCWQGYIHHHSSQQQQQQQQQQTYSSTPYYCSNAESSTTNLSTTYVAPTNDENESFVHYQAACVDDVYVTAPNYYVTTSNGDEMMSSSSSSLNYQTTNTNWNPVITAPTKMSVIQQNPPSTVTLPSTCWDWLLYPPDIYSHLYVPLPSFPHQRQEEKNDDDLDLLASLPTWLLALLYPSTKQLYTIDDENDSDQEINSLPNTPDEALLSMNIEKKLTNVSSNLSENSLHALKSEQNRSSTPDTDDGYQSASDASRSDYSQQSSLHCDRPNSKDDRTMNVPSSLMPRRISYAAAAVKQITAPLINKISSVSTAINKSKNNSSSSSTINDGQKLKFTAPRFERMHHAKQYSTTTSSSSSTTLLTNRTQVRSNNNNNNNQQQRSLIINSSRRR